MPKLGMEPIRRKALVQATIETIGEAGSLDVTVGQIAKRAGMSSALAHHYFGGKEQIFLAAMLHILREFGQEVRSLLAKAQTSAQRLEAILQANFAQSCYTPATTTAWMSFYSQAQTVPEAARMLQIYQRRLRSNLTHALRPLSKNPSRDAESIAAMIDGLYIRSVLSHLSPEDAMAIIRHTLNALIGADE